MPESNTPINDNTGVLEIRTWGTKNQKSSNFKENLKVGLLGGNIGHAALAIKVPYNEENLALVQRYCKPNNIPYSININKTADLDFDPETGQYIKTEGLAHHKKSIVIYFSWWPDHISAFRLNTPSEDYEDEWRGRKFKWDPASTAYFQPQERQVKGKLPISHTITLGPQSIDLQFAYKDKDYSIINQLEQFNVESQQLMNDYFLLNKLMWLENTQQFSSSFIEFLREYHGDFFEKLKEVLAENHHQWAKDFYDALIQEKTPEHFDILFYFSKLNRTIVKKAQTIKDNYHLDGMAMTREVEALEQLVVLIDRRRFELQEKNMNRFSEEAVDVINLLEAFQTECRKLLNTNPSSSELYTIFEKYSPDFRKIKIDERDYENADDYKRTRILLDQYKTILKGNKKKINDNIDVDVGDFLQAIQAYTNDLCYSLPDFFHGNEGRNIKKKLNRHYPEWQSKTNIPDMILSSEIISLKKSIQQKIKEEFTGNLDKQSISGVHPDQVITLPVHIGRENNSSKLHGLPLEAMLQEMENLVKTERYKTLKANSSEVVRKVVNAGLESIGTKLHKRNLLNVTTPQTLIHDAIKAASYISELNYNKFREEIRRNQPLNFVNLLIRKKDRLFEKLCSQGQLPSVEFDRMFVSYESEIDYKHKIYANRIKEIEELLVSNYAQILEIIYINTMSELSRRDIKKFAAFIQGDGAFPKNLDELAELSTFTRDFIQYDILVHNRNKTKLNAFKRWIDIAELLHDKKLYAPFLDIINTLNSPNIDNCKLFNYLPNSYKNKLKQFTELCSPESGYKNARENLDLFGESSLVPFSFFTKETLDPRPNDDFVNTMDAQVHNSERTKENLDESQSIIVEKICRLQEKKGDPIDDYFESRSAIAQANLDKCHPRTARHGLFSSKKSPEKSERFFEHGEHSVLGV